jgi:hypothetical protein
MRDDVVYDELEPFRMIKTHSHNVVIFEGSLYHKWKYSNWKQIIFQFPAK